MRGTKVISILTAFCLNKHELNFCFTINFTIYIAHMRQNTLRASTEKYKYTLPNSSHEFVNPFRKYVCNL